MKNDYDKFAKRFSASYMSNAKWRKLFLAWVQSQVDVQHAEWSYIDSSNVSVIPLPRERDILETHFADGRFQPTEYKWTRSIRIPR